MSKKRILYKFEWDCGRNGYLEGLFVATETEVMAIMDTNICFGEVLGKHSHIEAVLEKDDLIIKSEDQDFINKLEEVMGKFEGCSFTICGHNPLDYGEEEF